MPSPTTSFRLLSGLVALAATALVLGGCSLLPSTSAGPVEITPTPAALPVPDGAKTIEEAWEVLGCSVEDGTAKKIIETDYVTDRTATCDPWDDLDATVGFYQVPDAESMVFLVERAMAEFPPVSLFVDGLVLVRAIDEPATERLKPLYDQYE